MVWCRLLGMLCAGGFIKEAIISTSFVLFANIVLRYVSKIINYQVERQNTSETFSIKLTPENNLENSITYINNFIAKNETLEKISFKVTENTITMTLKVNQNKDRLIEKLISNLEEQYSLKNYEYKKISSTKLEEYQDEM